MLKIYSLIICLFLSLSLANAQVPGTPSGVNPGAQQAASGTVQGKLVDGATNEPVGYASVRVVREDGSLVVGELSKDDGTYSLKNVPFGENYKLVVSFLGYKEAASELFSLTPEKPVYVSPELRLGTDAQMLNEVEVTGEKAITQIGIERKVYNVEKDLMSKGGSLQDVLKNVPSVDVNADNKVTLRGNEDVKILINGERSGLTANANFLSQLPASAVERIEIITSPSAKFDPEGTSGIINIVLKENKNKGVSGTANVGYGYGNDHKAEAGISVNYMSPKFSLSSGFSYRYSPSEYEGISDRYNLLNDSIYLISQTDNGSWDHQSFLIRLGMDFTPGKKNAFGFTYVTQLLERESRADIRYSIYDRTLMNPETKIRHTFGSDPFTFNGNVRSYFRHNLKKAGANLRFSANYSTTSGLPDDYYEEFLTDEFFNRISESYLFERTNEETWSHEFDGSVDLVYPLNDKMNIETGYKGSMNKRDNSFFGQFEDIATGTWYNDTTRTNQFLLNEHIEAAYGTFQHTIDKFTYKLGLRMEYVWMNSTLVNTGEDFQNNYYGIYPTLNLSYKMPKDQTVTFGFSRRVQRPGMWALNPFPDYSDPLNIRMGNPFLRPQFINSLETGYNRYFNKGNFSGSVYYRLSTDVLNRVRIFDAENVSTVTWANVDKTHSWGVELVGDYKPFKWWNISANANLFQTKTVGSAAGLDFNSDNFSWNAGLTNTFNFWKSANIQATFRYRAKFENVQFVIFPFTNFDLAFRKSFLKDNRATIAVRGSDLFNTLRFKLESKEPNVVQTMERHWESRQFWLTFSYNFGKIGNNNRNRQQQNFNQGDGAPDMMGP